LKTPNLPGFVARACLRMSTLVCFWAKKLILVIIHEFVPKNAQFSSIQFLIAKFLGDPAHFNRPGLPEDGFLKTNNVKGVFLQLLFEASLEWFAKKTAF
jgi:hypothetical protein